MLQNSRHLWLKMIEEDDMYSFETLFTRHSAPLIKFAQMWVKQREVAEELVLDLFLKIWQSRHKLLDVNNYEVYMYVSLKNLCLNYLRKNSGKEHVPLENEMETACQSVTADVRMEMKDLQQSINMAINTLPPQCQLIFRLIRYEELTYKEVAEILKLSVNTVHTQMVRAVKKLHAVLEPLLDSHRRR